MTNRFAVSIVVAVLVILAVPAQAGSPEVMLSLHNARGTGDVSACGSEHSMKIYKVGDNVRYSGTIVPAPAGQYKVTVKVKRCIDGAWTLVMTDVAQGGPNGAFSGSFPVNGRSKCFVRAIYEGERSNKAFFRVRT